MHNQCAEMCTGLRASCHVTSATSQTESKQPPVCVSPPAVWPLSVKQGPTRWASRSSTLPRSLTALLDRLVSVLPLHRSPLPVQCLV